MKLWRKRWQIRGTDVVHGTGYTTVLARKFWLRDSALTEAASMNLHATLIRYTVEPIER